MTNGEPRPPVPVVSPTFWMGSICVLLVSGIVPPKFKTLGELYCKNSRCQLNFWQIEPIFLFSTQNQPFFRKFLRTPRFASLDP